MSNRKINDILTDNPRQHSPLQRLLHQSATQDAWTAEIRALLPESLARQCKVTEVSPRKIAIVCNNAASATKLRFLIADLRTQLEQLAHYRSAGEVVIRVSGEQSSFSRPPNVGTDRNQP
jgi:hypothetical protein